LKEMTYLMRHPLRAGLVAKKLSGRLTASENLMDPAAITREAAYLIDIGQFPAQPPAGRNHLPGTDEDARGNKGKG
jgi:hypothetical protein